MDSDIVKTLVKPPQWQDGGTYDGSAAWLSFNEKGRFCYGVDLAGIFYMQTPDGEQEGFPTLAAAQAAAEADYRARIAAALDLDALAGLVKALEHIAKSDEHDDPYDPCGWAIDTARAALAAFRSQP